MKIVAIMEFAGGADASGVAVLAAPLGYIALFAFSRGAAIWVSASEIFAKAMRINRQAAASRRRTIAA